MIKTDRAERFYADGYLFPIPVLSAAEATANRHQLESLEARLVGSRLGNKSQLNYAHVIFRFADEIARNPQILDVVEALLGPDIMVWGSTFFTKEPYTESYVSWHQDLRYWGLDDENGQVSAWVALGPVTKANGCMKFVTRSHQSGLVDHKDTYHEENFLTRGQQADVAIDENDVVSVELQPGEASFHHGRLLHASSPNRSDQRRIGYVINYIAPHVRQTVAPEDFAMLVRGQDRYGHFHQVPAPDSDLSEDALAWHSRILAAQNEAIYDGAAPAAIS